MSTPARPVQQRSKLFVDRRLQGGIVRRILWHWLTFIAAGTVIGVTVRWLTHPTVPLSQQFGEMFAAFGPFLVALLALLPIFVLDTIKLTNRFAGPYVRFRQHIRAFLDGRSPGPIKFRDGDYWRETEDDLNKMFAELQALCREVREPLEGDVTRPAAAVGSSARGDA
ncbi:MAG: hypothetical protein U0992_02670 [Planctomycetaceae bacterium]